MDGWVKIYRKIADGPDWFAEVFTKPQAWIDLILIANHKDGFFYVRGNKVIVKRGQIGWSPEKLGERWRWSRGKVIRFLKTLENDEQIVQHKSHITTTLSIINYELYQGNGTTDDTTSSTTDGQQTDNRRTQTRIIKNNKKEKKEESPTWKNDFFVYKEECANAFKSLTSNPEFMAKLKTYYPEPNIDYQMSVAHLYEGYCKTEECWIKKKSSKIQNIDWKATIINMLRYHLMKTSESKKGW
jgi:hypothetical protein